ncbi:homoserine dehydrogenase [Pseudalkalibacillus caeni]|uniref:Homoserine dehydrogenase n=1 Tax=Exobacillus caeni TaxID=2574798 RepID=A0A5R9F5J4_9BACL|nr:homoserine dehydrogenase [Pseudalkalibacillus caeni]TLS38797.1 homoserine dehydrogenase [Pseudalkalibacillus caeni]
MSKLKVALLGFGTVGSGVYEAVKTHQQRLETLLGKPVEVAAVLIKDEQKKRNVDSNVLFTSNIEKVLETPGLNVVMEAIVGVEPGYTYLSKAMEKGCHIVTANKELFAHKGIELKKKARENNVNILFEAAVAGGIPIIGTLRKLLQVNDVSKVTGILNGTSNYILSDIRTRQIPFSRALEAAQQKGYAEADPVNDVEGWDAFYKLMILSELLYGVQPEWTETTRKGIRDVSFGDICIAEAFGLRIKHIATVERSLEGLKARVEPVMMAPSHPLYSIEGVDNAVTVTGDLVGEVTLTGPGAGAKPTASAMVEDLLHVQDSNHPFVHEKIKGENQESTLKDDNRLQDWLLVVPSINLPDDVVVHEAKTLTVNGKSVTGYYVSGSVATVNRLLKQYSTLVVYPVEGEGLRFESKELVIVNTR